MRALFCWLLLSGVAAASQVPVSTAAELRAAIARATAGDEIVLASGTYALSGVTCGATGPITVRAAEPLGAKIEFDALEGFLVTGAGWRFEGLDVRGVCAQDDDCEHAFHVVGGATGFVLRASRVHDFNAQLKVNALAGALPHDGLVEGNELFDTRPRSTSKPVTKIDIDTGDRWIVRANYVHDFHRLDAEPTYGAYMKSGGKNGLFERNLVICSAEVPSTGPEVGLSFGDGGTAPQFCAPAFDANVPCDVEHTGGILRNNVVVQCTDVGIYLARAQDSHVLHNTLIGTNGIDFRFATTSGEARGNLISQSIRPRDGATFSQADNLTGLSVADFQQLYVDPLAGDLRAKGSLAMLLEKAAPLAVVPDDYCGRARGTGRYDIGALQHSLGDCVTTRPPLGSALPSPSPGDGGSASPPGGDANPPSSSPASSSSGGCALGGARSPRGDAGCLWIFIGVISIVFRIRFRIHS